MAALAHEARRFGAKVVIRQCGHNVDHVDIFDTPDFITIRLWDAGYREFFADQIVDHWRWCETMVDCERPTTPPPPR